VQTAISFYGDTRSNRDELESLDVPFLGIFARDDRATPPEAVEQFESLLEELDKKAKVVVMHNVGRFFSNEDRPGYDPEATSGAWYYTKEFLADNLNGAEYVPRHKGRVFLDEPLAKDRRWKKKPPR
jgi:dienelactone hydrolase